MVDRNATTSSLVMSVPVGGGAEVSRGGGDFASDAGGGVDLGRLVSGPALVLGCSLRGWLLPLVSLIGSSTFPFPSSCSGDIRATRLMRLLGSFRGVLGELLLVRKDASSSGFPMMISMTSSGAAAAEGVEALDAAGDADSLGSGAAVCRLGLESTRDTLVVVPLSPLPSASSRFPQIGMMESVSA